MPVIDHNTIIRLLEKHPEGLKASQIAFILKAERSDVNHVLYKYKKEYFFDNDLHVWFLIKRNNRKLIGNHDKSVNKETEDTEENSCLFDYDEYIQEMKNNYSLNRRSIRNDLEVDEIDQIKDSIPYNFEEDEYIFPAQLIDYLDEWNVPLHYYKQFVNSAIEWNRDIFHTRKMIKDIIQNPAKIYEEPSTNKKNGKNKSVKINCDRAEENNDEEDEDDAILLDTYDELSYFHRKNTKNQKIKSDGVIHVIETGEIKQFKMTILDEENLTIEQTQGDAIEIETERMKRAGEYRITIKGVKQGLSILDCTAGESVIQIAVLVLNGDLI